jgi:hypothetical protein
MTLRADDRVLFLAMPPVQEIATTARILMRGVVVVLGSEAELEEARAALSEFQNVLLLDAHPDRVPWRKAFFTKIVVAPQLDRILPSLTPEITRLLAPEGEIVRSGVLA